MKLPFSNTKCLYFPFLNAWSSCCAIMHLQTPRTWMSTVYMLLCNLYVISSGISTNRGKRKYQKHVFSAYYVLLIHPTASVWLEIKFNSIKHPSAVFFYLTGIKTRCDSVVRGSRGKSKYSASVFLAQRMWFSRAHAAHDAVPNRAVWQEDDVFNSGSLTPPPRSILHYLYPVVFAPWTNKAWPPL